VDRGPGRRGEAFAFEVGGDGLGAGVEPFFGQLGAQGKDAGLHHVDCGLGVGAGSAGAGFEARVALGRVPGEEFVDPLAADSIAAGSL